MRLANALALLGMSILSLGGGSGRAEARRVHYDVGGHRYWYNPDKKGSAKRAERRARRQAGLSHQADDAALPLPPSKPQDLMLALSAAPSSLVQAPVPAIVSIRAVDALQASVGLSVQAVPPPPGPSLVRTVSYNFQTGTKTTSLTDGTVFVESFDPKAFFRMVPDYGPSATSSTLAATMPIAGY